MHPFDIFVVISGGFSILATLPLIYLASHSFRDARELRRVQSEVAELMVEVREIQHEIHLEQRSTKDVVERVAAATQRRRRRPRIRLELS
jgi:hypothetical protein